MPPFQPLFAGEPLRIEWSRRLRVYRGRLESDCGRGDPVHAASFIRERRLVLDPGLRRRLGEHARIALHELFHFAWVRLGNPSRSSWEAILHAEMKQRARGELGWSSEWRKRELTPSGVRHRSRPWREYICESFCDSAAWLYGGLSGHEEFTLASRFRRRRKRWFREWNSHHEGTVRI